MTTPRGIQEMYYTRDLPSRAVPIARLNTPPLTPAQLTDVSNFPYQEGSLGVWLASGVITPTPDFIAPDFNQSLLIFGSVDYILRNQFFQLTNIQAVNSQPLYYYHTLPSAQVAGVTVLDLTGTVVSANTLLVNNILYHDLDGAAYRVRFVDQATGRLTTQLLHYTPVMSSNPYNATPASYVFGGQDLTVFSIDPIFIRFLVPNGYRVLPPYSTPPNTPWYARVRFGLTPPAAEWARQLFLPLRPYMLAAWVPGAVLASDLIEFERKQVFYDPQHLPDVLVYDQDFKLKYALEGTAPNLPRRRGSLYPWKRGLIADIDPYEGRVSVGVSLESTDIVFGFYSYVEPDVLYRGIDLNPFTNPAVKNKVVQFYYLNDIVGSPYRNIFHEILDPADSLSGANDPPSAPTPGKIVFGRVSVGSTVGEHNFTLTDIRQRGGGLAPAYQGIPQATNFWDLGFWDGKPYPLGGSLALYLPAAILDVLTVDDIQGKLANALPAGALPVIRFYTENGTEFVV